jgi:hypothetical protein
MQRRAHTLLSPFRRARSMPAVRAARNALLVSA